MKRRIILTMMMAFVLLSLSGCKIADTGLDEGEMNQVAEYTAKLLLRHVRGYEPNLLERLEVEDNPSLVNENFEVLGEEKKPEEKREEEKKSEDKEEVKGAKEGIEEKQEGKKPIGEQASEEKSSEEKKEEKSDGSGSMAKQLSDIYGIEGLDAVFGGAGIFSKYPKNEGYFSLVAPEGMKLFVATIILKNTSSKELHFIHDKDVSYGLDFYKMGKVYRPSVTLLERDIKFLDTKLKAGDSTSGVIVFNIPSSIQMKDVNLVISGKGMKYEISASQ